MARSRATRNAMIEMKMDKTKKQSIIIPKKKPMKNGEKRDR
jgi:hypothetical protein